jgi:hypothetical protein
MNQIIPSFAAFPSDHQGVYAGLYEIQFSQTVQAKI